MNSQDFNFLFSSLKYFRQAFDKYCSKIVKVFLVFPYSGKIKTICVRNNKFER